MRDIIAYDPPSHYSAPEDIRAKLRKFYAHWALKEAYVKMTVSSSFTHFLILFIFIFFVSLFCPGPSRRRVSRRWVPEMKTSCARPGPGMLTQVLAGEISNGCSRSSREVLRFTRDRAVPLHAEGRGKQ